MKAINTMISMCCSVNISFTSYAVTSTFYTEILDNAKVTGHVHAMGMKRKAMSDNKKLCLDLLIHQHFTHMYSLDLNYVQANFKQHLKYIYIYL